MDRIMHQTMRSSLFSFRKQARAPGLVLVVSAHVAVALIAIFAVTELPEAIKQKVTQVTIPIELPPPPVERPRVVPRERPIEPRTETPPPPQVVTPEVPPITESPTAPQLPSTPLLSSNQTATDPGTPTGTATGSPSSDVAVVCPNVRAVQANMRYPVQARRDGVQGEVIVQFTLTAAGQVRDPRVIAAPSGAANTLGRAAVAGVREFQCVGQGRDVVVEAPFAFRLNE